jgi:hypothetical protein
MRGDIVLFLGLVTVVGGGIIVGVILFFGAEGADNPCDNSLASLGQSDISQLGFQTEDVGLTRVILAAQAGNLDAVQSAFFGDVHNFTHNVDAPLREANDELAKELCEAVIEIEDEFVIDRRLSVIVGQATRIRDLLRDAAEALGFARPGG